MPLGPGYIDPQGIYRYGEADERPLGSDLLNLLAGSTSATVADIRDELQAIRDLTTPQEVTPAGKAPEITFGASNLVTKIGRIVHVQLHVTSSVALTVGKGLFWLPAPYGSKSLFPIVSWYGSGQSGPLTLAGSGQLQTQAAVPVVGATVLYGGFTYVAAS